MITNITEKYVDEIEAYSIRFNLLNFTFYWETYWNEDKIEHTISIYKNNQHQLNVSGSKEFIKNKILNWIDDSIISIRNRK